MKAKEYMEQFEPIFYPMGKLPEELPSDDSISTAYGIFKRV